MEYSVLEIVGQPNVYSEFRYDVPPPPGFGKGKDAYSNKAIPPRNSLPSLSREHFRPLFCFSTPWYSSCDENSFKETSSSEVPVEGKNSSGSRNENAAARSFFASGQNMLETDLVGDAVELLPDDEQSIPRATAGSDPPCSLQQNDFIITSQATILHEDELPQAERAVEDTLSTHSEKTIGESDSCYESDGSLSYADSDDFGRYAAFEEKFASKSWRSGSATSSLRAFKEDERSPIDPELENTETSSYEEISYGTESALETDIVLKESCSTIDCGSDNVLSPKSVPGAFRSPYIAEYTIPQFGGAPGRYDDLLATLNSTHAQVAVMKQQYIEILEDLRRKLK